MFKGFQFAGSPAEFTCPQGHSSNLGGFPFHVNKFLDVLTNVANLAKLMTRDREIDMAELDKAWTAANPDT